MHTTVAVFIGAFFVGLAVGIPIGAYGWYRFGSRLKSEAQKVETAVTDFKGKVSGK